jgi:esterase/lipase
MLRTRFAKDIVCEFLPPTRKVKKDKVIIFAMGLVSNPFKRRLAQYYADRGFWFFVPRYRGVWESSGKFLAKEPTVDIKDAIDGIYKGFIDLPYSGLLKPKRYSFSKPEIHLIGSSFGGPATLFLSKDPRVKKVICKSPVVDNTKDTRVERLAWFGPFIRRAYGEAVRFSDNDWKKLSNGKFYNPATRSAEVDGSKVMIFHAKDDDIVSYKPVEAFAKKVGATLITSAKGGHYSADFLMKPSVAKKIIHFFNDKEK